MGQAEQRELIKPITKKLTIIYIPKVIHPCTTSFTMEQTLPSMS